MRSAYFHQMSHTYHLEQCNYILPSHWNCETFELLMINREPIQTICTGEITLKSAIIQLFIGKWERRNFLMIGYVRWQNRPDCGCSAFLRLFCTSLFPIPKTLACLPEAMKLLSYSYFVWLLVVSFTPIKTEQRLSCFGSATNTSEARGPAIRS